MQRFSSDVYRERLARAAVLTGDAGLDGIVVSTGPDLRYLTGSRANTFERLTALVIPAAGSPRLVVARLELASLAESADIMAGRQWPVTVPPLGTTQ